MKKLILSICCLLTLNIFTGINAIADVKGGWQLVNNDWFYNEGSNQLKGCTKVIDGKSYSFTKDGVWIDDTGYDEANIAKNMDTLSIFYKLNDMSIDSMCPGPQSLKFYWGGNPDNKTEIESTYGMIIVDSHDYGISSKELMHKNWKEDLQIVKNEDGSISLVVNN